MVRWASAFRMEETRGNTVEVLGPGRVFIVLDGPIDEGDAQAMVHGCRQASKAGRLYVLADLRKMGKVTPAARQAFQGGLKSLPTRAVSVVGLSLTLRALAKLVFGAVNVVKRDKVRFRFFGRVESARQWFDQISS